MSWCMCSRARLERRSLLTVDRAAVLMRLSPLKERSALHEVTGRVQRTVTRAWIFGKNPEIFGKVEERDEGSADEPWSFSSVFHFVY